MLSLYKLININFWKSIIAPFFAFAFPIIFVGILGSLLGYNNIFGGILAIGPMSIGIIALPQTIYEFKRSVLLKRIAASPLRPWKILFVIAFYYFKIMIISTFWTVLIAFLIFSSNYNSGRVEATRTLPLGTEVVEFDILAVSLKTFFNNVAWGGFLWAILANCMLSISIGLFLVSVLKSAVAIQGIGIPLLILSQFLSAQVLPLAIIRSVDAVWYFSYITPYKYTIGLTLESWSGSAIGVGDPDLFNKTLTLQLGPSSNVFDIKDMFLIYDKDTNLISVFDQTNKILNLVMPFVCIIIFSILSVKYFKWGIR